jgi:hypothetical protein
MKKDFRGKYFDTEGGREASERRSVRLGNEQQCSALPRLRLGA